MNDRQQLDAMLADLTRRKVPEAPEHDADYYRGKLKVLAEHAKGITRDLAQLEQTRARLEQQQRLVEQERRESILLSRNLLTRAEVGRITGLASGTIAKVIAHELQRRGMGPRL